jgi:hypothetical protein
LSITDDQALGKDRAQVLRQIQEDLLVLVLREHVDDAIERLRAVVRVQRRENEVARARQVDRGLHRLLVADFSDQDDVGGRTHDAAQRARETLRVESDFALVDDRTLVRVQELDRVLDRHDVIRRGLVAMVDHRGDRSRLAGARGADHQDEPALHHDEVLEHLGQAELVELRHVGADVAQHHCGIAALVEHVDAEPAQAGFGDREVDLELALEALELVGAHEPVRRLANRLGRQDLLVDRENRAFDLHLDR